jgi:hypothetical protein
VNAITRADTVKRFVIKHVTGLVVIPAKEFAYCVHDGNMLLIESKTKDPTLHKWLHLIANLHMLHAHGELGFDLSKAMFVLVIGDLGETAKVAMRRIKEVDDEITDRVLAYRIKELFDDGHILSRWQSNQVVDIITASQRP